mgnify:CR=1 FL=1
MKEARFDFSGGINVYADKSILEPRTCTVADNVDLRSGMPRAFDMPSFVCNATYNANCLYEYRGKFYTSNARRDYCAEFVNGQDVLYYTQQGTIPRKIVGGIDVRLGTPRPTLAPVVTVGTNLQTVLSAKAGNSGSIPHNTVRSYRVAVRTERGVAVPSGSATVTIVGTRYKKGSNWEYANDGSVSLSWTPVTGAINYLVYAGNGVGQEQLVATLPAGQLTWSDYGNNTASGEYASNYDSTAPYAYVYTFERFINGIIDESAPSEIAYAVGGGGSRTITFSPEDGFMDDAVRVTSGVALYDSASAFPALDVVEVVNQPGFKQVKFKTRTPHELKAGDKVAITIYDDSNWQKRVVEVLPDASAVPLADIFYAKDCPEVKGTTGMARVCKSKIVMSAPPTDRAYEGDVVRLTLKNCKDINGKAVSQLYGKATPISYNTYVIDVYTGRAGSSAVVCTEAAWVPHNGYIRYRKLYRVGDTSQFQLVAELNPWEMSYQDNAPASSLGQVLPSSYTENGVDVLFDVPPLGLEMPTLHGGMLFGIDGHKVRWTPINQHDAWPDNFYFLFQDKPVAIASFAQALIVLCTDAIYRIEGTEATQLVKIGTGADLGCIAPHSVQVSERGLFYLSRKGVMVFDGTRAECITDKKVSGDFFIATSSPQPVDFPMVATQDSQAYAWLCQTDGLLGGSPNGDTNPPEGVIYAIRSFIHDGRYWLYYGGDPNYGSNGMVGIDFSAAEMPIITLGLRPIDVHVSRAEECFMLFSGAPPVTTVKIISPLPDGESLDPIPAAPTVIDVSKFDPLDYPAQADTPPANQLHEAKTYAGINSIYEYAYVGERFGVGGFGGIEGVSRPENLTYEWTLSDGKRATGLAPEFVFDTPGRVDVTLKVTNTYDGTYGVATSHIKVAASKPTVTSTAVTLPNLYFGSGVIVSELADGRVLFFHGVKPSRTMPEWDNAYIFDGSTFTVVESPDFMPHNQYTYPLFDADKSGFTARLNSGKIMYASLGDPEHKAVELFDPATGTWSRTGDLSTAAKSPWASLLTLPNGNVLALVNGVDSASEAHLYDAASGTWSLAATPPAKLGTVFSVDNNRVIGIGTDDSSPACIYYIDGNRWETRGIRIPYGEVLIRMTGLRAGLHDPSFYKDGYIYVDYMINTSTFIAERYTRPICGRKRGAYTLSYYTTRFYPEVGHPVPGFGYTDADGEMLGHAPFLNMTNIFEDPEIGWGFMLNGKMSYLHHRKSTTTAYLEVLNL